jgi:tetratricopeptide (TPR) repeat protein
VSVWRGGAALAAIALLTACATAPAPPPPPSTASTYADHLVGRVANARQDYSAAYERYARALARDPGNQALIDGAVVAALAAGDAAQARQAARGAAGEDASAYAQILHAADQLAAGRTRQASDTLSNIEGAGAEELVARMLLVWPRAAQGDVDEVIADLAPLSSIRPYGALFTYQQAMALDLAGRNDEALAAYARAAEGSIFLPTATARHADLLARTGARDEAIRLLRTDGNANNPTLIATAARIEQRASGPRLTPARGAAIGLHGLAALFSQERDSTNALATLSLALVLDPELDAARLMFAQIQSELGNGELSRRALSAINANSPYGPSARVMEAWLLADEGRGDEALTLARTVADAGDLRAKRALADMYRNQQRYAEAEPLYGELIEATPSDWRLYFARGAARERLHRWPEAEADLLRALEIAPDQPDVLNYLGYTWVDRGERLEEGLAMLQRAFNLRPSSGAIVDSLGWAHYRLGNYDEALTYLEGAIQMEPTDPTLNDHLGDIYWRLGRRIEARFQWERALTLNPDNAEAIQAKLEGGLPDEPPAQSANR